MVIMNTYSVVSVSTGGTGNKRYMVAAAGTIVTSRLIHGLQLIFRGVVSRSFLHWLCSPQSSAIRAAASLLLLSSR